MKRHRKQRGYLRTRRGITETLRKAKSFKEFGKEGACKGTKEFLIAKPKTKAKETYEKQKNVCLQQRDYLQDLRKRYVLYVLEASS